MFDDLLNNISEFCVAHVHGHNYMGAFVDYMRHYDFVEMPVVNPGALSLGEYGSIKLVHNVEGEHSHWYVAETSKKYIPSFEYHDATSEDKYEMYHDDEDPEHEESHHFHHHDDDEHDDIDDDENELNLGKDVIKNSKEKPKERHFTKGVNPNVMSSLLNKSISQN